jgi:hypothetical protein
MYTFSVTVFFWIFVYELRFVYKRVMAAELDTSVIYEPLQVQNVAEWV